MITERPATPTSSRALLVYVYLLVAVTIVVCGTIAGALVNRQLQAHRIEKESSDYHLDTRLDLSRIEFELNAVERALVRRLSEKRNKDISVSDHRGMARSFTVIGRYMQSISAAQRRFAHPNFEAATERLVAAIQQLEQPMANDAHKPPVSELFLSALDLVQTRCIQLDRLHANAAYDKQAMVRNHLDTNRFVAGMSILVVIGSLSILLMLGLARRAMRRRELAEAALANRALQAELLYGAISLTNETDSLEVALQQCVDIVCKMTNVPVGHVYVPSESDATRLEPTEIWYVADEGRFAKFRAVTQQTHLARGDGLPGRIWQSGKPAWIVNVQHDDNFPRNKLGDDLGVKAAFGFPIKLQGQLAAVLEFFSDREMEQDEILLLMVRNFAEQVGHEFERKAVEKQLREMDAQLAHVSRLSTMGEMVAGIAHEINQPLSAIANFALACKNTLETSAYDYDVPIENWLQQVNQQAVRCGDIIRRLRNFVKKGDINRECIDLNCVVRDSIALIQSDVRHQSVVIDCRLPNPGPQIYANQVQIQQVLVNLLRNACDATRSETTPEIRICVDHEHGGVQLSVEDNGPGVEEAEQEKLFDAFFTTKEDGMGMGLAISMSIIEAHGGSLRLELGRSSGARFLVDLPATESAIARQQRVA